MPLTSAAQMITVGRTFRNCLKDPNKIAEVLLGYAYHYVIEPHPDRDAEPTRYVAEVTPLSNGGWMVGPIAGVKGQTVSAEAKAAVLARMLALGALAPPTRRATPKPRRWKERWASTASTRSVATSWRSQPMRRHCYEPAV